MANVCLHFDSQQPLLQMHFSFSISSFTVCWPLNLFFFFAQDPPNLKMWARNCCSLLRLVCTDGRVDSFHPTATTSHRNTATRLRKMWCSSPSPPYSLSRSQVNQGLSVAIYSIAWSHFKNYYNEQEPNSNITERLRPMTQYIFLKWE